MPIPFTAGKAEITGFEPVHPFYRMDGLANHCDTVTPYFHKAEEERVERSQRMITLSEFSRFYSTPNASFHKETHVRVELTKIVLQTTGSPFAI